MIAQMFPGMEWIPLIVLCVLCPLFVVVGMVVLALGLVFWPWFSPDNSPIGRKTSAFLALMVAVGIGPLAHSLWRSHRGEQNITALLNGDRQVKFQQIEVHGQQRRVLCSDPIILRYLENRFRDHHAERNNMGTTYSVALVFEDGGRFDGVTYWFTRGFSTYVGVTPGDGLPTHEITFVEPMPAQMKKIIDFLDLPWQDLKQSVLTLPPED